MLRDVFLVGTAPSQGQHLLRASTVKNCCCRSSAPRLPFIVISTKFPLSTFGLKARGEDFTAAFYPLHKDNRLLGGRRNGNTSSERQRRGDSWALMCADTQGAPSALSTHSLASMGDPRHYPTQWFPRGFFPCLLDSGKWMQANRQGGHLGITSTGRFR